MSWCNYWNCECLHTPSFIDGECSAYCIEEKEETDMTTNKHSVKVFKEKGIEVAVYESSFHSIEGVSIDTYEHDKQMKLDIMNEIMPILIEIVDKEGSCYGYEKAIDELELEWKKLNKF